MEIGVSECCWEVRPRWMSRLLKRGCLRYAKLGCMMRWLGRLLSLRMLVLIGTLSRTTGQRFEQH